MSDQDGKPRGILRWLGFGSAAADYDADLTTPDEAEQRRHPVDAQPVVGALALLEQPVPGGAGDDDCRRDGESGSGGARQPVSLAHQHVLLERGKVRPARRRGDREHFQCQGHRDTFRPDL